MANNDNNITAKNNKNFNSSNNNDEEGNQGDNQYEGGYEENNNYIINSPSNDKGHYGDKLHHTAYTYASITKMKRHNIEKTSIKLFINIIRKNNCF